MPINRSRRAAVALAAGILAATAPARAQDAGPIALLVPVSAQTAAMGNAGVAARDDYALFHNPAMTGTVSGVGLTVGGYATDARTIALVSGA
ncbi:MAG TPA: hypothetical protein VG916_02675, partial [Gemmatimonadaceae bacterium]|nr:hypothetical protein [Gemmatimonadaceae bacterium]